MTDTTLSEPSLSPSLSGLSHSRKTSWFESLKHYVQKTDVSSLNLSNMGLKTAEVASILEFLAKSQVVELDLSRSNYKNEIESLSQILVRTNIKKLNLSSCHLTNDDVLHLIRVLKETQITDLDISGSFRLRFSKNYSSAFISCLAVSRLTALNLANCYFDGDDEEVLLFFRALRNTSVTHLNLDRTLRLCKRGEDIRLTLFFELEHTLITHLKLGWFGLGYCDLKKLGNSLRDSKLIELHLDCNMIQDDKMDDLFTAIMGSKINTLNLSSNAFRGDNNLGLFLKDTQITSLDLGNNYRIRSKKMFAFPDFLKASMVESLNLRACLLSDDFGVPLMKSLRFSKVKHLNVCRNSFKLPSISAFADIVKDTDLVEFNFSTVMCDDHLAGLKLILIGVLSASSKIQHVDVREFHKSLSNEPNTVAAFLEKLVTSSVTALSMIRFGLGKRGADVISPVLANMPFTHLNLACNEIGDGVLSLAANLKFTAITHLNLSRNDINDEGAKTLAGCLKETRIIDLDLSYNKIMCDGAAALALFLKHATVFSLKLNENKIGSKGLEALAEYIKPNLITSLDVSGNPGNLFVVEAAIWNNRTLIHQLINAFNRIKPESIDKVLQVGNFVSAPNIESFLEQFLSSYKIVSEQPSAASILAREERIMLSKYEIMTFLTDTFPQKFAAFIANNIEASLLEHVKFLRKVEDMKLNAIVELLLLNRPVYFIDKSRSILHPYVYKLLIKYKLPICNLDVEPQGIEKIVEYFTIFVDIEGAAEVVSMLQTL